MKKVGDVFAGVDVGGQGISGTLDIDADPYICATADFVASGCARKAVIDGVFSAIPAGADVGMVLNLGVSYDSGATWELPYLSLRPTQAHLKSGRWSNMRAQGTLDVAAGTTLRFALHVDRGGMIGANQIGNSTCNLRVRMQNSNGFTAP
jgi:hypothetical protein